jgi:hypothetical protein
MNRILVLVTFLLATFVSFSQNLKWVNALKSNANTIVKDVQISPDNSGYYTCGYFSNTVNFNPKGTAVELTSTVGTDAFIAKYDNDGALLWVDTTFYTGGDGFNKLAVSADGSRLFVCGYSNYGAQFMGYLLARINPTTGAKIWKRNFSGGGFYQNEAQDLIADESVSEGVFVAGYTRNGITIDLDPVTPGQQGTSAGGKYSSIVRFDKDAIFLNQFLGNYHIDAATVQTSIVRGNDNYIYAALGGLPSIGTNVFFNITKHDDNLTLLASSKSSQQPPVTGDLESISLGTGGELKLAKDQTSNDIYAYGSFEGTRDFNTSISVTNQWTSNGTGTTDIFVAKYNSSNLNYINSWRTGGAGNDNPVYMHVNTAGVSKIIGNFDGTAIFGSTSLYSNGLKDGFIADFNSTSGAYISAKNLGGLGNDLILTGHVDETSSTMLLGGYFGSPTNFDFISENALETPFNAVDGFAALYKTCILPNAIAGPSSVCRGTDFTLTASATGDNLSYQWYKDGLILTDGTSFSGTNTAVLTVNYNGSSWGRYKCLISNTCDEAYTADYIMDLNDGLILHHDYTNGNLADVSGNAPNGTGGGSFSTDRFGNASAAFNPTFGQTVTVANIPSLPIGNAAYTYSVWINNSSANPTNFGVMGYGPNATRQGNRIVRGSDANRIDNDWINDPMTINTGFIGVDSWLQIICTYDPKTRIQKGVHSYSPNFTTQRSIVNTPNFVASDFKIGVAGLSGNFTGKIDEPRMYKRAISSLETNILMNLPNISKQPVNTVACLNQTTYLVVKGESLNGEVSYLWYKDGVALSNGSNIAGADSDSLIISNTSALDEGNYFVEVYDNCHLILSKKVNVTTQTNTIEITSQPIAAQSICEGLDVAMEVQTSGATPTSYQWFKDGNEVLFSNSNNLTLLFTNAQTAGNYYVEIYGGSCGTLTSETSVVTMKAATSITTQPVSTSSCLGGSVALNVVAQGEGTLSYEWKENGTTLSEISASLTVNSVSSTNDYTVTVNGECGSVTSNVANITLKTATAITTHPQSQESCSGPTVSISVNATGDNLSYQWKKDGADLTGQTAFFITFFAVNPSDAGDYSVDVSGTCGDITSNTATITVNPATTITAQPISANVCIGGSQNFEVQASGSGTLSYQWKKDGIDLLGQTASTLTLSNLNTNDNGDYSVNVTSDCGSILSDIATLAVSQISTTLNESACVSYVFDGVTQTQSGTYTATYSTAAGCDSIVILELSILQPTTSLLFETACDSYELNGQTYTQSGLYTQTLTNSVGCDSTITLNLTITHPATSTFNATGCISYSLNGQTYTTDGTYIQNLTTVNGCDSTLTLNLTISTVATSTITANACSSYSLNGQEYTASGVYTQTLTSTQGCDSIITLNLTINQPSASVLTEVACGSYDLNGQLYSLSGIYTQVLTNASGCDSTINLNLTINQPSASVLTEVACGSYELNGQLYTSTGTFTQTLTNASGCDSTITLNLTINQPSSSMLTETACGSYELNGQVYDQSGTFTQVILNVAGCDSTITLNLSITPNSVSSFNETVCDTYTWNTEIYTQSGIYQQVFPSANGCDSIVTLNLLLITLQLIP